MSILAPESTEQQQETQGTDEREAVVLPFSRERLGRGARYGKLPVSLDSPVYLPGDPRLEN